MSCRPSQSSAAAERDSNVEVPSKKGPAERLVSLCLRGPWKGEASRQLRCLHHVRPVLHYFGLALAPLLLPDEIERVLQR